MSEEQINEIKLLITEIKALHKYRCPNNEEKLAEAREDIDAAHSKIRKLEIKAAVFALVVSLLTPVITAILVKALVR